jgi:hypothetical protein
MPEVKRPADVTLREMVGKPESEVIAWWTTRWRQIAAIPVGTARAGAIIPMLREVSALSKDQRLAMTKSRVLGFVELDQQEKDKVFEARKLAARLAPELEQDDRQVMLEILPTLPSDVADRLRAQLEELPAAGSR